MWNTSLALLALMLIGLPARSDAQAAPAAEPSAQQKVVLSYFHDVLDGGKIDLVDSIFQPDCEIHFGSSDVQFFRSSWRRGAKKNDVLQTDLLGARYFQVGRSGRCTTHAPSYGGWSLAFEDRDS